MDHDFCFLIHIYDEFTAAERLIRQIRTLYPTVELLVLLDGTQPPQSFADAWFWNQSSHLFRLVRLKEVRYGGQWTHRYLQFFLHMTGVKYCVKLDPDSWVWRSLHSFPEGDIFGEIIQTSHRWQQLVLGGAIGFTRHAAAELIKRLLDPYYQTKEFSYRRPSTGEPLSMQDAIVADAAQRAGLKLAPWSEVRVSWEPPAIANPNLQYAITHPYQESSYAERIHSQS